MHSQNGLQEHADYEIRQVRFFITNISHFLTHIRSVADENGCHIILFDATKMAGKRHVIASLDHAIRSFNEGTCISNSLEMETLLYASGTRQTHIAKQFGIHGGTNESYLCCFPYKGRVWPALSPHMTEVDEDWEIITPEKEARLIEIFGITRMEREAARNASLSDLVIERVALLEVMK